MRHMSKAVAVATAAVPVGQPVVAVASSGEASSAREYEKKHEKMKLMAK